MKISSARRRQTKRSFYPSALSLGKAQQLAKALGVAVEDEHLRDKAESLLHDLFEDILQVLDVDKSAFAFEDYSLDRIDVFTEPGSVDTKRVYMDQRYPLWLLDLNLITGIWAIADITNDDVQDLGDLFEYHLRIWNDITILDEVSERTWPYYARFPEIAALSASLMTAGVVFALCHELAHHDHDHFAQPQSAAQETEADLTAYQFFLKVYAAADHVSAARIDHQALAAPCLALSFIAMLERWNAKQGGLKSVPLSQYHPKASERVSVLKSAFFQEWTPQALRIFDGFSASLDELARGLGIQDIR